MTGAVRGVAGASNGFAGYVIGVTAEVALQDATFGCAVKRQAHVFEFKHGINRFIAHELDGILIAEIIRAFYRIIRVPFGMIFFGVAERRADSALRRASMGTCGI